MVDIAGGGLTRADHHNRERAIAVPSDPEPNKMIMANIDWSKMVTADAKAAEVLAAKHAAVNTERERKIAAGAMVAAPALATSPCRGAKPMCATCKASA